MTTQRARTSLGRAIVWFVAAYGVAIAGYLALNAAAGRLLGPDTFGYFIVLLTVTTLLGQLGLIGAHRSGLREAARLTEEHTDELSTLRRGVRAVNLVTLPATAIATGVVTWWILSGESPAQRWAVTLATAVLVMLSGQQKLWANYLRGFGAVRFASLLEGRSGGALVAVLQAALVASVWLLAPQWGLPGALVAVGVGYAIPVWLAARAVRRRWRHVRIRARLFTDLREVVLRDWRFAVVQAGAYLNATLDVWIAAILLSSIDTSMFSAGQRLAQLLILPMTSLQIVFSPVIARLAVGDDRREMERLLRTGSSLATVVTGLIWVPMLVAPAWMLTTVFGSGYADASPILLLLTTGFFVNALTGMSGVTLSMSHHEGSVALVHWSAVLARVVLGSFAALAFGVVGLAVTSMAAYLLVYAAMWTSARRKAGVNTHATLRPDIKLIRRTAG